MALNDRFLRISEVEKVFGWSRSTIYRKVKEKILPAPVRLGPNTVAWRESEINAFVRAMVSDRLPSTFPDGPNEEGPTYGHVRAL